MSPPPLPPGTLAEAVAEAQRRVICATLAETPSVDESAKRLGVDRSSLYKLMKRLNIPVPTQTLDRTPGHTEWKPWAKMPPRPPQPDRG